MTDNITLSLNELRALLRRTYEALYHHGYDFGVMARSCLWLETHGLDGIGLILRSLDDLDTPCLQMQLTEAAAGHYIIDGQGRCLIPFINSATDLAIARAKQNGAGLIDVLNVFGRLNVFAALKCCRIITGCLHGMTGLGGVPVCGLSARMHPIRSRRKCAQFCLLMLCQSKQPRTLKLPMSVPSITA